MSDRRRMVRRAGAPGVLGAALILAYPAMAQPVPFPSTTMEGEGLAGGGDLAGSASSDGFSEAGTGTGTVLGDATGSLGTISPVRLGGFGAPLGYVGNPGEPTRAWTVVPSLGAQVLATDNLFQTERDRRSDIITTFSPGIYISANTPRLTGRVSYAPQIEFYANTPGQDRVDHNFNGQALAVLVPGFAYLDLRGLASTRTATGGYAPENTTLVNRGNRVQTTSFQISPYIIQRFGGLGTVQLGYALGQSAQDGDNAFLRGGAQPYFTSQNYVSNEIFGVARSGQDLGRLNLEARASATTYQGTGVLDDAHRASTSVQAAYAFTRAFAALVEGGYENQRYSGVPPVEISGPIWSVGARLTPDPDSTIIIRYGRRDGFNSASLEAGTAIGARTRLNASYSDRLTTDTLRNQDLLAATSLDSSGQPTDRITGAPISYGNTLLGTQDSLRRIRRAAAGITHVWTRDTVTLSASHEDQDPVSVVPGTVAFSQRAVSTNLAWSHELTPVTSSVAYVQYGNYRSANFGTGNVATFSASLFHRVTPRLTANLQYALSRRTDDFNGASVQNIVLVGLRQEF